MAKCAGTALRENQKLGKPRLVTPLKANRNVHPELLSISPTISLSKNDVLQL